MGEYLQDKLSEFKNHPLVGEVRGRNLIGAVELVANKETGKLSKILQSALTPNRHVRIMDFLLEL